MASQIVTIPGIAVPLRIEAGSWMAFRLYAGEVRLKQKLFSGKFTAPGTDGQPVEGKMRATAFTMWPKIEVDGVRYATGPDAPTWLKILAGLPVGLIILVQGALGFLIAFGGLFVNMGLLRAQKPVGPTAALMALVFVIGATIDVAVLYALIQNGS